ncbi:MAG: hypothetical protein ACK5QT_03495 [Oligoflexia bacterium]|jgi:hypothetical protein
MNHQNWIPAISMIFLVGIGLSHRPAAAKPGAMLCKPCPGQPLEFSIHQAEAVVLARVTHELLPKPQKLPPGQAQSGQLEVKVLEWLRRPTGSPAAQLPTQMSVRFSWDGACKAAPRLTPRQSRIILFLSKTEDGQWEALSHACALTDLDPSRAEGGVAGLKKRLKKSSI